MAVKKQIERLAGTEDNCGRSQSTVARWFSGDAAITQRRSRLKRRTGDSIPASRRLGNWLDRDRWNNRYNHALLR